MERKWWTLVLVSVATFMLLLDVTIVNVALPDIQRSLHASLSSLQWVVDAYSLMLASFLLTAGSLGDRLGRRRVFTIGFGIFTFASFLCGISHDPTLLNLCRGLQGVGGAGMFATSLALIGQEFQGKDRATAFGVLGATVGGAVAGPLIGGVITENFGWEWIFFVNVPIGIVAMFLTERKVRNVFAKNPEPFDIPGLVTFSASLFLFIFALIRGNPEGWGSTTILACLIGAAVLMALFIAIQVRSSHPMLELSLFRNPAFNGVSAVAFCLSAGMFALFLYITIYFQGVLDYSPLRPAGFLPLTVLGFVASRWPERSPTGSRSVPARQRADLGRDRPAAHARHLGRLGVDYAPGRLPRRRDRLGVTNPGIGQAAIAVVPVEKSGMGSGINSTFRQRDRHGSRRAWRHLPVAGELQAERTRAPPPTRVSRNRRVEPLARGGSSPPPAGDRRQAVTLPTSPSSAPSTRFLIAAILSFVGAIAVSSWSAPPRSWSADG